VDADEWEPGGNFFRTFLPATGPRSWLEASDTIRGSGAFNRISPRHRCGPDDPARAPAQPGVLDAEPHVRRGDCLPAGYESTIRRVTFDVVATRQAPSGGTIFPRPRLRRDAEGL